MPPRAPDDDPNTLVWAARVLTVLFFVFNEGYPATGPGTDPVRHHLTTDRRDAGYVLELDPDVVDLHRFARLVDEGRNSRGADEDRAAALTTALGLWRGTPLAGLRGDWVNQVRSNWHRRRLDAVVRWDGSRSGSAVPTT